MSKTIKTIKTKTIQFHLEKPPPTSFKKWIGVFTYPDGSVIRTPFGDRRYQDYTIHKDKERRERYRIRHAKDLDTHDFTRAGFLSYYILWGDSTSLQTNTELFKKKFTKNV